MTELENKILITLNTKANKLKKYDEKCKAEYDKLMKKAENQVDEYWKKDFIHQAEWALSFQKHEYDFVQEWKNIIAMVMYNRIYHEWHSAQAGRYRGTGHGAYITSELTTEERSNIDKVFNGLVKHGYLRLSKTGKQAKLIK